jgi:hypothetical protein
LWIRVFPFFEPNPPATQFSSASRPTDAWCVAKCQVSCDRFWSETYSSFALCSTKSSTTAFEEAARPGVAEEYSSISVKLLSGYAISSRRQ